MHVEITACATFLAFYFEDRVEIRALSGRVVRQGPPARYGWVGYPVSAGGELCANRVSEKELVVREVESGRVLSTIALGDHADGALAFAPREQVLAVANAGALELWGARAGRLLRSFPAAHLRGRPDVLGPPAFAFSADGAVAFLDGDAIVVAR